jgi:hemerythrin-like domain-containing protein
MATKGKAPAAQDAITLLKKDHEKVRGLLKKLETAALRGDSNAEELLQNIDREVKIHSQVEEEIFYPAFHEAARTKEQNKLFFEAKEEHHVVDMVMPEVSEFEGNEDFAAKAKVLKDLIEHHADEEEKEMFPAAKKLMGKDELRELGSRIQRRKEELGAE